MDKGIIVIADKNELYLNNLAEYILEREPGIGLITVSQKDTLTQYLKHSEKLDILLVGDSFMSGKPGKLPEFSAFTAPGADAERLYLRCRQHLQLWYAQQIWTGFRIGSEI